MLLLNNGLSTIKAAAANIIVRFDEFELVAVQHSNGFVGLYAEDEDDLVQMTSLTKSATLTPVEIATKLLGL